MAQTQVFKQFDFSGAVQTGSSRLLRKRNEVLRSRNAAFNIKIGSAGRRNGYVKLGNTVQDGKDGLGLYVYRYQTGDKLIVGINNSADTNATLRRFTDPSWTDIITNAPAGLRWALQNHLDDLFISGMAWASDTYYPMRVMGSDNALSTTRNVFGAPACRLIAEYKRKLYAINCEVGGVKYRDRAYVSSAPTGAITYVRSDQSGTLTGLLVDSVKYLKIGMIVDIYTAGTDTKVVDSLTITAVDKNLNKITFASASITVKDNDELWLEDRKGKLSLLWNTDHPTPEEADFLQVPAGMESAPEFIGYGKSNNRLFLFTRNSFWKYDGQNFVAVSETIGTTAHETIKSVGGWLIWLHTTGLWAYNDGTGQLMRLSRSVQDYFRGISENSLKYASAGVTENVYKVHIGQLTRNGELEDGYVRMVYDFDMNAFWPEYHTREIRFQVNYTRNNETKPYFLDNTGKVYQDDTGNTDDGDLIPFELELGDNNFGVDEMKKYNSVYVYATNPRSVLIKAKVDGATAVDLGEITKQIQQFEFPFGKSEGRELNYLLSYTDDGDPTLIDGLSTHLTLSEAQYAGSKR